MIEQNVNIKIFLFYTWEMGTSFKEYLNLDYFLNLRLIINLSLDLDNKNIKDQEKDENPPRCPLTRWLRIA